MATVIVDVTNAPPLPTGHLSEEQRILIPRVSWNFYVEFRDELDHQGERSVHLTYDRGSLEIMVTGAPHEWYKKILANLFVILTYELDIPYRCGGSMTFQRQDLDRGLEPDECWWIAHERELRGRNDYDPHADPPPDLAVEVEMTSPLLDKMNIYSALGVPEIWRFDGERLRFWRRGQDGHYQRSETSLTFAFLRPEHLEPYLQIHEPMDDGARVKRFAEWLRGIDRR